jgi:hypothetical protein
MVVRLLGLLRLVVVVHRMLYFVCSMSESRSWSWSWSRSSENIPGSGLLELSGQDDDAIWMDGQR